jgi:ketosteroid isomerase-like protein
MEKTEENTKEIRLATKEFYTALHAMFEGDATPMEKVWSHADDVTYLGPQGGILKGWNQVLSAWKEQAAKKLQGNVEVKDMHILQEGNIAITQSYEIGTNYINGMAKTIRIRAINIFRKEGGKWKMVTHQTDILPFLDK